jgi:hypothetical protein
MVAAGKAKREGGGLPQPSGPKAKDVSPTETKELGGGVRVEFAAIEGVECLAKKRQGKPLGKLMLFKRQLTRGRKAPPSLARKQPSLILFPPQQKFRR